MSRGDQLARQWRILQKMVACRGGVTVGEIAREENCSPRTVYRDLTALQDAGFPMTTDRDDPHTLWKFVDGYRFSIPIPFSIDELMALYYSRGMFRVFEGTPFHDSLERLLRKVRSSLTPETQTLVDRFEHVFESGQRPAKDYGRFREIINQVNKACGDRKRLEIVYYTLSRERETRRRVDPYRIGYFEGALYLIGYCHWRKGVRMFALDRIRLLNVTDEAFEMPADFSLERYMADAFHLIQDTPVEVKVRFTGKAALWVADRIWHPSQQLIRSRDRSVTASYRVGGTSEIKRWIQSFGTMAEVLEPADLREEVARDAAALVEAYGGRAPGSRPGRTQKA